MKVTSSILISIICIFNTCLEVSAQMPSADLPKEALIEKMQSGGLVLYIRHASTENDYADQVSANVNDGSTQRVLSEKGWHEAVQLGEAFEYYQIPVGDVLTSQYFRAWQTAWLAFGSYEKHEALNFLPSESYSDEQIQLMKERLMPYLIKVPKGNKNTVIVAHDDPFEAVTGIYPEPMGICFVLEPKQNGNFDILGSIAIADWK